MAESIITDSSNYSEDFEESFESEEDSGLYQETDVFPQLFNFLETSLAQDAFVNYRAQETPPQLAVGLFLARAKLSKSDFMNKLRWEYTKKKELLLKSVKVEPVCSTFPKALKSILCQMRVENDFIARNMKRKISLVTDEVRNQTFVNLAALAKDKNQADARMANERTAIFKKSEELEDLFVWKRFYELIKTLLPNKILLSTPAEKQKAEIKNVLDNYLQMGFAIKNAVTLEDADYPVALGNKRFGNREDRKMEISEVCSDLSKVQELLNMLLTFAKRPGRGKSLNGKVQKGFLNRAFINLQRPTCEESLSQYLFVLENEADLTKFQKLDFTTVEEDLSTSITTQEVQNLHLSNTKASIHIQNHQVTLRAATIEDLSSLPGSPLANQTKSSSLMFTLFRDSFYKCKSSRKTFIRSISPSESQELFNIYFYQNSEKRVHPDCFPDPFRPSFKYKYIVIKDVIVINSGIFSKHWLVQLKPSDGKKSLNDFCLPRICKWEACMSSLVEEVHLTKMATEFSSLTNKVKLISKKGLNPLKKSRTASEAIVVPDLCIFHNNLRSIMRNEGLATKRLIYDNSIELWKASQAGLNWQEEFSESNKLSKLCSGAVKKAFSVFLNEFCESLNTRTTDEEGDGSFYSQKGQVVGEVESLKKMAEIEVMCTQDLIRIFNSGANSSYLKYALSTIQDAVNLQTSSKCLKIRSLKDQIESFLALKMQNQSEPFVYQPSIRVSTAKQAELNSTYNESSRKAKEDLGKKMVSPYYEPKLRVIKRFQKLRIPRSACDERTNKS